MKNLIISSLILVSTLLLGASCAHKQGSSRAQRTTSSSAEYSGARSRDLSVSLSNKRGDRNKLDGEEVFAKYNTAVFMVYTSDGWNGYQGSGFFINSNGLAVSNYHVFKDTSVGMEAIKLYGSDKLYKVVEVIKQSEESDFILFRVDISNTNYIPIARTKPKVGEKVYAMGSPRGLENTFSSGEISGWRDTYLIQTNVKIDHGSSGGALINEYGEVVGITSGTLADGSQANLNYAWSIDVIKPYVKMH